MVNGLVTKLPKNSRLGDESVSIRTRYNWRELSEEEKEQILSDIKQKDREMLSYMNCLSRKSGIWDLIKRAERQGITETQLLLYIMSCCCYMTDKEQYIEQKRKQDGENNRAGQIPGIYLWTYIDKNDVETIAWIRGIPTWRKSAGQQSVQAVDSIVCQKESD